MAPRGNALAHVPQVPSHRADTCRLGRPNGRPLLGPAPGSWSFARVERVLRPSDLVARLSRRAANVPTKFRVRFMQVDPRRLEIVLAPELAHDAFHDRRHG